MEIATIGEAAHLDVYPDVVRICLHVADRMLQARDAADTRPVWKGNQFITYVIAFLSLCLIEPRYCDKASTCCMVLMQLCFIGYDNVEF